LKSLGALLLVGLLLCHWLGLTVAVHRFEDAYRQASPLTANDEWLEVKVPLAIPYAQPWANPEGQEGLLEVNGHFYNITEQRYENDTLYTTLKTNLGAREQFSQLSDQINGLIIGQAEPSPEPTGGTTKLLKDFFKVYVAFAAPGLPEMGVAEVPAANAWARYARFAPDPSLSSPTPPPKS